MVALVAQRPENVGLPELEQVFQRPVSGDVRVLTSEHRIVALPAGARLREAVREFYTLGSESVDIGRLRAVRAEGTDGIEA